VFLCGCFFVWFGCVLSFVCAFPACVAVIFGPLFFFFPFFFFFFFFSSRKKRKNA